MKHFTLFRLKCPCSVRMRRRGKLITVFGRDKAVNCPNCGKQYVIRCSYLFPKRLQPLKVKVTTTIPNKIARRITMLAKELKNRKDK